MGAGGSLVVLIVWLLSPITPGGSAVMLHLLDGIAVPSSVTIALGVLVGSIMNLIFHRKGAPAVSLAPNLATSAKQ